MRQIKIYLLTILIISILISLFFFIINKSSYPLKEKKFIQTDTIFLNLNNKAPDYNSILLSKNITNQLLITTEPNLSFFINFIE